jgi:hypothetical protein
MRFQEITERATTPSTIKSMSDQDRHEWIMFLMRWLRGDMMNKVSSEHLAKWEEFSRLFPHAVSRPIPLYRLITIPRQYVSLDEFPLQQPAPGPVSSWTSTKVGLDCVAGVARDFAEGNELEETTARIAIGAMIEPQYLLATVRSIRQAFLSLTHDWNENMEHSVIEPKEEDGRKYNLIHTRYHPYLGDDSEDFHMDLGYYIGLCTAFKGGPYRQYEHIVRTHPVQAKKVLVYRDGTRTVRYGNDDPHN